MNFDSFKTEWESKRVGDLLLTHVGVPLDQIYQCVSLIKQYLREDYGIEAGYWGNAIDYWHTTNPALLMKFDRLATQDVRKGDIVILNGLSGNTAGHVGIATGNSNSSQFELFEQNGQTGGGTGLNGDAIRTRYITKSRISGVLRPKPAVAAAPAVVHPYTIQLIDPKQVVINKPTHKWGLNYDNLTAILNKPEGVAAQGDIKTVTAICHHTIGYNYYLEDPRVASGYNVVDCIDYTAPAIPIVPPVKPQLPAAPLIAPSKEIYAVVKRIPGYLTSGQAATHQNSNSTVEPGEYNVYNRYNNMINITKKPGYAGWWINPRDNVAAPFVSAFPQPPPAAAVTPTTPAASTPAIEPNWKSSYVPFVDKYGQRTPVKYVALANYTVKDLETRKADVPLPLGWWVWIGGTFKKDNIIYARPQDAVQNFIWYGIPLDEGIIEPYDKVHSPKTTTADRQTLHTMTLRDYIVVISEQLARFWDTVTLKNKP